MKKVIMIMLLAVLSFASFTGCGEKNEDINNATSVSVPEAGAGETAERGGGADTGESGIKVPEDMAGSDGIDVDLTKLSSTMVYSEVFAMVMSPDEYVGKTIRMRGSFAVMTDDANSNFYTYTVIADATACCQQGIEFLWNGHPYPDGAYPPEGSEITVTGTFETYDEAGTKYCRIVSDEVEI